MREILFRGKRQDNNEWIEGCLIRVYERISRAVYQPREYAIQSAEDWIAPPFVVAETVGQYTGLTDKNGKRIFEGDIVKYHLWDDKFDYCEVKFGYFYAAMDSYNGGPALGFYLADINGKADDRGFSQNIYKFVEVIGNIHDNPELLQEDRQ